MVICGIDPGVTGALAFLSVRTERPVIKAIVPMPVNRTWASKKKIGRGKAAFDWHAIAQALRDFKPDLTIVEQQWPRPTEGVVSSFLSGGGYHGLLAVLSTLGLPYELVPPATWKNALGLRKQEKRASLELANRLMPEGRALFTRKMDHGNAEAALIVIWKVKYETTPLVRNLGTKVGPRPGHAIPD